MLHQVCLSDFVTYQWTDFILSSFDGNVDWSNDFRVTSISTFQALTSLCTLAGDTINNSRARFDATSYVTIDLSSPDILEARAQSLIDEFWGSTKTDFLSSLSIVQNITQANALLSASLTNAFFGYSFGNPYATVFPSIYADCDCYLSAWCAEPSPIHDDTLVEIVLTVRGMLTGCYTLEALLQSTLECFYDQPCFDELTAALSQTIRPNVSILDATAASNFSATSKLGEILNELMAEKWIWAVNYSGYYAQCRPSECHYTVKRRNDVIYIVTTVIGLVGGLVTALKVMIPLVVKVIRRKPNPRVQRTGNVNLQWFRANVRRCGQNKLYRTVSWLCTDEGGCWKTMMKLLFLDPDDRSD